MRRRLRQLALGSVRAWTRLYTWRLKPELRQARREQVESDLWESQRDPDAIGTGALHILVRLLAGVPDDLGWRLEQENTMAGHVKLRMAIMALVAVLAAVLVAISSTLWQPPLPDVPPPARTAGIGYLPAPPPPPPAPGGGGGIRFSYGETSYIVSGSMKPPVKVKDVRPIYPPIAEMYELRGTVVLEATVDESGRVVSARVVRSIPVLDHAAINAVRQWEFQPSLVGGGPVRHVITVTARFGLAKGA